VISLIAHFIAELPAASRWYHRPRDADRGDASMSESVARLFDLSGRVACLTGAASGIGRATAELLARAGASTVLADVDERGLQETLERVGRAGAKALGVPTDVRREGEVEALVERTVRELGRIDVMGNIAGIPQQSRIVDTSEADLDALLAVNLKGVFFGVKAALRRMIPQRSGSIINISSGVIDADTVETWACYGMAKAAVAMLTRVAAREGAPHGVRVNAVAPGLILTGFTERHWRDAPPAEQAQRRQAFLESAAQMAPLGRVGAPQDVAQTILYLVSDASSFVTGQILRPNGGVSMPW
jgi:3-oxoacyl-[acyl-carrier protein] reductase